MRWEALFEDLERRFEQINRESFEYDVAEHTQFERSRTFLSDRLRGALGIAVTVKTRSGLSVTGELVHVGSDWIVLREGVHSHVVLSAAVLSIKGVPRKALEETRAVHQKLGLGAALRGIAALAAPVIIHLSEQTQLTGLIIGVGADFIEFTSQDRSERIAAQQVALIPYAQLIAVTSFD